MQQRGIRIRGRMIPAGTSPFPAPRHRAACQPACRVPEARSPGLHLGDSAAQGPGRGKAQEGYFAVPATGVYGSMNSPSAFTGSHFS